MGVIVITDEGSAPSTPADGSALYSTGSLLYYKDESGTVHEIVTDNNPSIGSGVVTNTMLATDVKVGSLATLNTTPKTSVVAAIGTATPTTTAKTVVGAINELDADIASIFGGASATDQLLKDWTTGEAYELTAVTYDSDGVPTTATAKWPDASAGTFTTTSKNSTWLAIDAYTISHTDSGKTVTQAAVTRDSNGQVTVKPALTVA